jgi:hypothetical protein
MIEFPRLDVEGGIVAVQSVVWKWPDRELADRSALLSYAFDGEGTECRVPLAYLPGGPFACHRLRWASCKTKYFGCRQANLSAFSASIWRLAQIRHCWFSVVSTIRAKRAELQRPR